MMMVNTPICVFDAYGTLFDVNSAASKARDTLGEKWQSLSEIWRAKQLQYTWLRSLMGSYADFWQVTGDALAFALDTLGLHEEGLHERLMQCYLELPPYPEVKDVLNRLRQAGVLTAILSNGSPRMLAAAVKSARIEQLIDAIISVDQVRTYKPHPSVYRLVTDRLNVPPAQIWFVSANAWDAHGARAYGFKVAWCNRFGQRSERLPEAPTVEIPSLEELPTHCLNP